MRIPTFLTAAALALFASLASAHDYKLGQIMIEHPHARPTLGQGKTSAGYLMLKNHGAADRLIRAESDIAERVELHTMSMTGGVMKMRPIEALDLPSGGEAQLAPGGEHIMLIGLKRKLAIGDSFPITLVFENSGAIEVTFMVEKPRGGMDHGKMGDGSMSHGSQGHMGHGSGGSAQE